MVGYKLIYGTYYFFSKDWKITVVKDSQTIAEENTSSSDELRDTSILSSSKNKADKENRAQPKEKPQ